MADGVHHETLLTIGFLNHDKDDLLPKYEDAFDIVILDDSPMSFVSLILESIPKS
jgi:5'-nucleotidase